jgi:hypothetical protein
MSKKEETYTPLKSSELEGYCCQSIAVILDKKNNEKDIEDLKKFINSLWVIYKELSRNFMSYNMLFEIYNYFKNNKNEWIKLSTDNKDVSINIKDKKIKILKFDCDVGKQCEIKIENELSDELYDFLTKFFCDTNIKLDLSKLHEKVTFLPDLDLSGI